LDTSPADRPAHLLVVDDEAHIREGLKWALTLAGYYVKEADSGNAALELLAAEPFDLIILDMAMPGLDGVETMRRARQICPDLLIVILTGHATLESAIAAVKADATDYLLKPASIHDVQKVVANALHGRAGRLRQRQLVELIGQAVDEIRQQEPAQQPPVAKPASRETEAPRTLWQAGSLTLDCSRRVAVVAGDPPRTVELSAGEEGVLRCLLQHPGQVRSCRQIVYAGWGYDLSEPEAASMVRSYIHRLRLKLEQDPNEPCRIRTVRGGGYYWDTSLDDA
jgi:DNA-binding response OmpR family regulator